MYADIRPCETFNFDGLITINVAINLVVCCVILKCLQCLGMAPKLRSAIALSVIDSSNLHNMA